MCSVSQALIGHALGKYLFPIGPSKITPFFKAKIPVPWIVRLFGETLSFWGAQTRPWTLTWRGLGSQNRWKLGRERSVGRNSSKRTQPRITPGHQGVLGPPKSQPLMVSGMSWHAFVDTNASPTPCCWTILVSVVQRS